MKKNLTGKMWRACTVGMCASRKWCACSTPCASSRWRACTYAWMVGRERERMRARRRRKRRSRRRRSRREEEEEEEVG